jgi:hypothetical protein
MVGYKKATLFSRMVAGYGLPIALYVSNNGPLYGKKYLYGRTLKRPYAAYKWRPNSGHQTESPAA